MSVRRLALGLAAMLAAASAQDSLTAPEVRSFRLRFGVGATAETAWDGAVTVTGGELIQTRNWHPRPGDALVGSNEWRLSTRKMVNYTWRPWEQVPNAGPREHYWTTGVIIDVRAGPGARVNVRTAQGRFAFRAADVRPLESLSFLNGAAVVDEVPPSEKLSDDSHENDFATVLGGSDGVWVAWVAYRDGGNQVLARRLENNRWGPTLEVTEAGGDVFLVKLGRDSGGRPWAVWSAQVDGAFNLHARPWEGSRWGAVEQLTDNAQPDVFHEVASDAAGALWVAWQGFRDGQSDIFVRRHDGAAWSSPFRVSSSAANDWSPALAADSKGSVTVGWDTYDTGDYDVVTRTYADGRWGDIVPVASTKLYEAHVSLVYDGRDRLWAAWNESGMNWGKDTGFTLQVQGTRLYEYRRLRLAARDGAKWLTPETDINEALPPQGYEPRYDDFPRLARDADGRVWIFARRRLQRRRDTPSSTPLHRASWEIWGTTLDGRRWLEPISFPFSQSRQDVRWGVTLDGAGSLFAAWQTDNRDFEEFLYQRADVYAARLPRLDRDVAEPALKPLVEPEPPFFDMAPTERDDLARIRDYVVESGGKRYKIYRGDTHRHTEISMDGNNDGSLFQAYRYALDAAQLDFLLTSDHNGSAGPDQPYVNWLLQQTVDVFSLPGRFQAFYGYERSIGYPDGHRNILFAERGKPTLPISEEERTHQQGAARLYEYLKREGGIAISHTSATGMGTDWRDNDPEVEPLVEIFQGDRVSSEYEGAPKAAHAANLNSAPGNFRPAGYVWNAWAKGYKLGVQAASDHLSTHLSYACTIAEDGSLPALLDAMKRRHSYGATDNIILDYRLRTDSGEEFLQGDIVKVSGGFRLWVKIAGTTPIRQIDVIKNQEFIYNRQKQPRETEFTFVDAQKEAGEDFYYVRVVQDDGNMAWSSPIWVTR